MANEDLCNINNQLQDEAGRIGEMIAAKLMGSDPWNALVTQETFPAGMGETINTLIQQRVVPPDVGPTAWTDVGINDGTGSSCNPDPQVLNFARDLSSYNLQQANIRTPGFCVNDIRIAWKAEDQLAAEYSVLKQNSDYFWKNRYRDEFFRLSGNKIVASGENVYAFPTSGSNEAWPLTPPTNALDQGFLDVWYLDLARDSAEGYYGMVNGMPQYALVTSPEASKYIQKQNSDIRQDLRFSTDVDDLLAPFGSTWNYSGFRHVIDNQAPRYRFVGGQFVRVPFYKSVPAYAGQKAIVNPDYITAPYEVSFIYNTNVYTSRVPNVITSPGGNTKFDPVNYRGEFWWINNQDNQCNILGDQGYFYARFMQGSQPKRTEWGYSIMHLRCAPAAQYVACSGS